MKRFSDLLPVLLVLLLLVFATGLAGVARAQCPGFLFHAWEWESSHGGWSGDETPTPASEGYTMQLEFLPSGVLRKFVDEALTGEYPWTMACSGDAAGRLTLPGWTVPEYLDVLRCGTLDVTVEQTPAGMRMVLTPYLCFDTYVDTYVQRDDIVVPATQTTWAGVKRLYGR